MKKRNFITGLSTIVLAFVITAAFLLFKPAVSSNAGIRPSASISCTGRNTPFPPKLEKP